MNLLWMTEDELRQTCWLLMAHVVRKEEERAELIEIAREAVSDGYRCGYADACADRALQVTIKVEERDAKGFSLH